MANQAGTERRWSRWRLAWGIPVVLMLLPLMFNAPWTLGDFVAAGILFGSAGLGIEFLVSRSENLSYRLGAVLSLAAIFLTIWVNGAVGMIGSEDNPYNMLFGAVLLIAVIGAVLARFRPAGMAVAMAAAAFAQASIAGFGLTADLRGGVFSLTFAGLWALAAALFRNAASDARQAAEAGVGG